MVKGDISETKEMMDFFAIAESMITEQTPYSKKNWTNVIEYLKTTHLFGGKPKEKA